MNDTNIHQETDCNQVNKFRKLNSLLRNSRCQKVGDNIDVGASVDVNKISEPTQKRTY